MNTNIDYYEILEVHPRASKEVIKKAYQTLAKKYHPDTTSLDKNEALKKMTLLNEAFSVLSDDKLRTEYDNLFKQQTEDKFSSSNNSKNNIRDEIFNYDCAIKIMILCEEIIKNIESNIKFEYGFEKDNLILCEKYSNYFNNNLGNPLIEMNKLRLNKQPVLSMIGFTYWRIATAYTWTQNFDKACFLVNQAAQFISKSDPFYDNFNKSFNHITSYLTSSKQKTKKGFLNKIKSIASYCFKHYPLQSALIVIVAIAFLSDPNTYKSTKATSLESNKPSPTYKTPNSSNLNTKKQDLIPKIGVLTSDVSSDSEKNFSKLNSGHCEITIDNSQNDTPVFVRIWNISKQSALQSFNIKQGDRFTSKNLPAGVYEVRYKNLYENNITDRGSKSEQFSLSEMPQADGYSYSRLSLTLYKVKNGNTHTYDIPADQV